MVLTVWIALLQAVCLAHASQYIPTRVLDHHGHRLEDIPEEMFVRHRNITHLILSNCSITSIHPRAFCGLEQLRMLDLSNNDIPSLDPDTLLCTPSLRLLYLPNNERLGSATHGPFLRSDSLTHLDIKNCGFNSFSPDTFIGLKNLKSVVASDNQACVSLRHNTWSVRNLKCGDNSIPITSTETPEMKVLSYPGEVTQLKIETISQTAIPERFLENQNLTHLHILDMSGLNITSVHPSAFCGLNSLISLDLSKNDLQFIDAFTFHCIPHLQNLSVANNPRLGFGSHRTFLYSNSIKHLNISNCGFTSYTEGMLSSIKTLKSADASGNVICSRMAEDLAHIVQVHCRDVAFDDSYAVIDFLPEDFFSELKWKDVVTLDLSNRSIGTIELSAFCSFRFLLELDLSDNNLRYLDPETFECTLLLENLYLTNNQMLQSDPNDVFLYSESLKYIDIENCSFSAFTDKMFSGMDSLIFLNAAGNPSCSQTTAHLRDISNVPCTDVFDPSINAYKIPSEQRSRFESGPVLAAALVQEDLSDVHSDTNSGMSQLLIITAIINVILVCSLLVTVIYYMRSKSHSRNNNMKQPLLSASTDKFN